MVVQTSRRLAGFRFEVQAPPPDDVLPRMDVAGFVGFAASGPLQTPVAVESPTQFADIFGTDAPLAWDPDRGETARAHLAPAVRAFFRNGGQRCWIIRVAGPAVSNLFAVPGLAWLLADGTIVPAFAPARSEGSWSDGLRVAATLEASVVVCESVDAADCTIGLGVAAANDIALGDLLRVSFDEAGYVLLFAVQSLRTPAQASPATQAVVAAVGAQALWLQKAGGKQPAVPVGAMMWFANGVPRKSIAAYAPVSWPTPAGDQTVAIAVACALAEAPPVGSLVRIDFGGDRFWLVVADASAGLDAGSPLANRVWLTGQGFWQLASPPGVLPSDPTVERLTFDLWVRQEQDYPVRLSGLGFTRDHPAFWGTLPTDAELFAADAPTSALAQEVATPRFPLAGPGVVGTFAFPLAMPLFPETFVGPAQDATTALQRDGLASFDARVFLGGADPTALRALLEAGTGQVIGVADFLRYQALQPRALQGIYAALAIDEATLIAVPDLVQRGWHKVQPAPPAPPQDASAAAVPPRLFACCDQQAVVPPALTTDASPAGTYFAASDGTFTLSWTPTATASFELQEALQPDYSDAATLYAGSGDRLDIYGHRQGDYYYRVRALVRGAWSGWSAGLVVRVAPPNDWQLCGAEGYDDNTLLVVQRALLRLCAGRGDLLAVLALPSHYREDAAIAHVVHLTSVAAADLSMTLSGADPQTAPPSDVVRCRRLSAGEAATASYGALYHPWLIGRDDGQPDTLRLVPPDGTACGVMAKRALARGAWVAPANESIAGPVALSPAISPDRWLDLLDAQVNLVRNEPRGFLALSADTLSGDDALRPINVRRLLILLRRLALRLGAEYVFEPNDDAFRRAVQRSFESVMEFLFARGAFAGSTPASSFQVITGSAVNTPQDQEEGRFFVELRVAPSLPLTFMTIRLVQSGAGSTIAEVI